MSSLQEIVSVKLEALAESIDEMNADHESMVALRTNHPQSYRESVHATSLATHIQGVFTGIESILAEMIKRIDGRVPAGESSHRDLLAAASKSTELRPRILSDQTRATVTELLGFRHVVRKNYSSVLRPAKVLENRAYAVEAASEVAADVRVFFEAFAPATKSSLQSDRSPGEDS